jgi:hypothetical protein
VNINTLEHELAERLGFNEIGAVMIEAKRPLYFDPYDESRITGAFILIDPLTNETLAAGMIKSGLAGESARAEEWLAAGEFSTGRVTPAERYVRAGHRPFAIWLEGGEELALALERKLFNRGCLVHVLGREVAAGVAKAFTDAGMISICLAAVHDTSAGESIERAVGGDRFVTVSAATLPDDAESAADEICRSLEQRGYIRPQPKPFTGGAGI